MSQGKSWTRDHAEDEAVRKRMQAIAKFLKGQLPFGWGFCLLAFPFGAGGRLNYVSNCERADVVRAMYEFIEATREQFGEHEAHRGAAAQDSELARLRQRVAELEGQLKGPLKEQLEVEVECEHLWEPWSPKPGFEPSVGRCVKCGAFMTGSETG